MATRDRSDEAFEQQRLTQRDDQREPGRRHLRSSFRRRMDVQCRAHDALQADQDAGVLQPPVKVGAA